MQTTESKTPEEEGTSEITLNLGPKAKVLFLPPSSPWLEHNPRVTALVLSPRKATGSWQYSAEDSNYRCQVTFNPTSHFETTP